MITNSGVITDYSYAGGRLGLYVYSQEMIHFAKLGYKCTGKSFISYDNLNKWIKLNLEIIQFYTMGCNRNLYNFIS